MEIDTSRKIKYTSAITMKKMLVFQNCLFHYTAELAYKAGLRSNVRWRQSGEQEEDYTTNITQRCITPGNRDVRGEEESRDELYNDQKMRSAPP